MPDYRVEVYKRAAFTERGSVDPYTAELYNETSARDWPHCLTVARVMARACPNFIVAACDAERDGLDTDGLSDEQRDEVWRNVEEARRG